MNWIGYHTGHWWMDALAILGIVMVPALIGSLYLPDAYDRLRGVSHD